MMDVQQLRCFVAVSRHLHFTKAAAELNIAQPHLSREIQRLERELEVTLFRRSTREVQLTEAGHAFLDRVENVFHEMEQAAAVARSVHTGQEGRIVVAFAGSTTYSWLPYLIRAYRARYPRVEVEILSEVLTGTQIELLDSGRIDLGLNRPPIDNAGIDTMVLDNEPLMVAVPSAHDLAVSGAKVPIRSLRSERFITYLNTVSTTQQAALKTCLDAGFVPNTVQAVGDTHSLISLVAAGMGIALVPRSAQYFSVAGVSFLPLTQESTRIQLLLTWRKSTVRPVVRNFVELVRELAATADAEWPGGRD
ncbi:MAG TPA: LysR substrate-binding domain-containing protein [Terrimesophilobacter sp.]|nr:LysR substrate-binding domain-containing protein [Terrimesophilobacter sp.]